MLKVKKNDKVKILQGNTGVVVDINCTRVGDRLQVDWHHVVRRLSEISIITGDQRQGFGYVNDLFVPITQIGLSVDPGASDLDHITVCCSIHSKLGVGVTGSGA